MHFLKKPIFVITSVDVLYTASGIASTKNSSRCSNYRQIVPVDNADIVEVFLISSAEGYLKERSRWCGTNAITFKLPTTISRLARANSRCIKRATSPSPDPT